MVCEHCGVEIEDVAMFVRLDNAETPVVLWCFDCVSRLEQISAERCGEVLGVHSPITDAWADD